MKKNKCKNIIIITGASSGIGAEFAKQTDSYFPDIDEFWLIARRREKLQNLACDMVHSARIITVDLTKEAFTDTILRYLQAAPVCVRMLINCAGYGLMGAFQPAAASHSRPQQEALVEQLGMIRLNCEALTAITYVCLPFMSAGSRIIQLASSAAFLPQADFAVYAASKAYVHSFSRALREELHRKQIYVTSVCPGPVDTPFFSIAEKQGQTLSLKKHAMVSAERVVSQALKDSYYKKAISVCSLPIKAFRLASGILPDSVLLAITGFLKERETK